MFLDRGNKMNLVPASFSYCLELLREKNKSSLKSVIIITVTISLHYKETNYIVLHCSCKKVVEKIKLGEFKSD